MANDNMSNEKVKSVVNGLECSPSKNDAHGHHGGKPGIVPTTKSSTATVDKMKTGEFAMSDRGKTLPNYKKQFAQKAQQA